MQEDPDDEERLPPTLVDHPVPPLVHEAIRLIRNSPEGGIGVGPLETLKPSTLGFVPLEMTSPTDDCQVGVLVQVRDLAIREV